MYRTLHTYQGQINTACGKIDTYLRINVGSLNGDCPVLGTCIDSYVCVLCWEFGAKAKRKSIAKFIALWQKIKLERDGREREVAFF